MHSPRQEPQRPEISDLELLRHAAAGSSSAFGAIVERHGDRLYALAVSLVSNAADAEEVLQETLLGAFRGMGRFRGQASVKTWLTRILVTQAARWLREQQRRRQYEVTGTPASAAAATPDMQRVLDLQSALARLSGEHREVLVLREFERLSYDEMAEVLQVPHGTIESRLFRARAALRELLEDYRQ